MTIFELYESSLPDRMSVRKDAVASALRVAASVRRSSVMFILIALLTACSGGGASTQPGLSAGSAVVPIVASPSIAGSAPLTNVGSPVDNGFVSPAPGVSGSPSGTGNSLGPAVTVSPDLPSGNQTPIIPISTNTAAPLNNGAATADLLAAVPVIMHYVLPPSNSTTTSSKLRFSSSSRGLQASAPYGGYTSTATTPISISVIFTPQGGTPSSPATGTCTPNTGGASGVCTVSLSTTPGPNMIAITLSAGGNVIASFSQMQILQSGTPTTLNFTANPVVASVQLALSAPTTYTNQITSISSPAVIAGAPATVPLAVNAYDANGNIIAGTGSYVDGTGRPIGLVLNVANVQAGGRGSMRISGPSRILSTNQMGTAVQYDGGWMESARISVTVPGSTVTNLTGASLATKPHIYEYTAPGSPLGIAAGSDGNIWFTEASANAVGRMSTAGTNVTTYTCPSPCSLPVIMTNGADGNIWFSEYNSAYVDKLSMDGTVTRVAPALNCLAAVATGPDGNIWTSSDCGQGIAKVSPSGVVTGYPTGIGVRGIGFGPDGNLWYTQNGATSVKELSLTGQVLASYTVSNLGAKADGVITGPDGNMWITNWGSNKIDKIVPGGNVTEYAVAGTNPSHIVAGNDGVLYFTERGSGTIGSITTAGGVSEYASSFGISSSAQPVGIILGPDGNIWFAENGVSKIGVFVL